MIREYVNSITLFFSICSKENMNIGIEIKMSSGLKNGASGVRNVKLPH
jgi:hypothetical protein